MPTATRTSKPPSLRCKKGRGVVTLTDPISKERKEFWLGPHGEPVIHGLLRQGETMNLVSSSKLGKTFLVLDLVISLATGRPWLNTYPVEKGRVLILDNELHEETIASRIPRVAEARGVPLRDFASNVDVASLRGGLEDVLSLAPWVSRKTPGRWKLVVLDASLA